MMKKILTVFGTRPEAVKMAPIIQQLAARPSNLRSIVCVTAQHREMLDRVLDLFSIIPDYDLNIMSENQNLFDVTSRVMEGIHGVIHKENPDLVLVQGDTTTAFAASLAAYYLKIPIGHVEAGLRTYDKYNPFPEEKNRHLVGVLADYHFAPTEWAKSNLLKENISPDRIWVTGNTVIDALLSIARLQETSEIEKKWCEYFKRTWGLNLSGQQNKILLVTGHRRESFGQGFKNICLALATIAERFPDIKIVYPVHLNPNVQKSVSEILGTIRSPDGIAGQLPGSKNISLIQPLDYEPFVFLMKKAYLLLTDSGGVQEEGPALGKPVLVMRETTERPEGIEAGTSRLVGTKVEEIVTVVCDLMGDSALYKKMAKVNNPYGDGKAADRIVDTLLSSIVL